jgi:GNAT superfamily N-acetyltransferase
MDARTYSVTEHLDDGRPVEIRAIRRGDEADMLAAVGRTSTQSLYRRFFTVRRHFSRKEIDYYLDVDFVDHVALVAVAEEAGGPVIVGGGRYVVVKPGTAEVAFAIIDAYQGHGLGTVLMRHLTGLARERSLTELTAEVLPENQSMLKVFEGSGLPMRTRREPDLVHVMLALS